MDTPPWVVVGQDVYCPTRNIYGVIANVIPPDGHDWQGQTTIEVTYDKPPHESVRFYANHFVQNWVLFHYPSKPIPRIWWARLLEEDLF